MAHPFIPAPNCALVEMVYTYGSQIIENTFHVKAASPFSAGDLSTLCNFFDAWDSTGASRWQTVRSIVNILTSVKARALDSPSAPVFVYALPAPRSGARTTGTPMPGNVTFCATWQTGLAGRSYRGRLFVPGINSPDIQGSPNQGLVVAGFASTVLASMTALLTQLAAHSPTWTPVVVSYYNNHAWRATAVATPIIAAAYADLAIDNQRRRLPGRGR